MTNSDPVSLALAYVTKLVNIVEKCRNEICSRVIEGEECKPGEGIARRANDMPGLIASAGLVPTLTFYMSKADKNILRDLVIILGKDDLGLNELPENFCKNAAEELGSRDKAGYNALLAVAVRGLIDLEGYLKEYNGSENVMLWLAEELERIRGSRSEIVAERRILELLTEVKKLATAFFKQEE